MAEFLIDANLPKRLVFWRHDACQMLPDAQWSDYTIWRYARQHKLTIATKDADFERLARAEGPPVVILLCVGRASRREIWGLLQKWRPIARDASRQPGCRLVKIYPEWVQVLHASDMA